jgi:phage terminase large subunit
MFKRTTAVNKILALKQRIKIIQGGSSAGKTMAIIAILVDRAIKNKEITISIVSSDLPHLKKGAMKDFKWFMRSTGRWNRDHWHKTDSVYTLSNGSVIEFIGIDDKDKAKGPRRTILFVNEANRITFDIYHQLAKRTDKEIFIDYNPTGRFWVHDIVKSQIDADFIILTFMDNEARPSNVDEDMRVSKENHDKQLNQYWVNDWLVYGLGQIGQLKGAVWTNWSTIKEIPKDAILLGLGLDFGYTNSQTAVIAVYEYANQEMFKGKRYIFDQWVYEKKLSNQSIAQMILSFDEYQNDLVYCDSAEPKSIQELKDNGVNAEACGSKSDIRKYAIQKIGKDEEEFYVTADSDGLIENLEGYVFAETKTGDLLNIPKKGKHDHCPDAIIYFIGTNDKYTGVYN